MNSPSSTALIRQAGSAALSREALQFVQEEVVIDLHLEPYLPKRLLGYDLRRNHRSRWNPGWLMGHLDFPQIEEGGLSGGMWSITTNIARGAEGKWNTLNRNLERLESELLATEGAFQPVRTCSEFRSVVEAGNHAALFVVQGGNALEAGVDRLGEIYGDLLTRVTLLHLTNSSLGITSSPLRLWKSNPGLTSLGKRLVEALNEQRILVDLAHIHPNGFWDAVDAHSNELPLIVTHTGVSGVAPHWRNLDDQQIRAIADSGGTIGIIFAKEFLARRGGPRDLEMVLEHMEYTIRVAGEEHVSIGSDLDGFIVPPADLRDGNCYARLVDGMLRRGWSVERMRRVCSENFLRTFEQIRP